MESLGNFIDIRCPGSDPDGDKAALSEHSTHDEGLTRNYENLNPPQTVTVEKKDLSTPLNCTRFEAHKCRTFMPTSRIEKPLPPLTAGWSPEGVELPKNYRFSVVRHVCNVRERVESALRDRAKEEEKKRISAETERIDDEALDL